MLTENGHEEYRSKQRDYLAVGGQYVLATLMEFIPSAKRRTCMMSVRTRNRTKIVGAALAEPLPVISIPLRPTDREISRNIQQLIHQVYDRGRYSKINYQHDPEPAFALEEAEWVAT